MAVRAEGGHVRAVGHLDASRLSHECRSEDLHPTQFELRLPWFAEKESLRLDYSKSYNVDGRLIYFSSITAV